MVLRVFFLIINILDRLPCDLPNFFLSLYISKHQISSKVVRSYHSDFPSLRPPVVKQFSTEFHVPITPKLNSVHVLSNNFLSHLNLTIIVRNTFPWVLYCNRYEGSQGRCVYSEGVSYYYRLLSSLFNLNYRHIYGSSPYRSLSETLHTFQDHGKISQTYNRTSMILDLFHKSYVLVYCDFHGTNLAIYDRISLLFSLRLFPLS